MQSTSKAERLQRAVALTAAAVLVAFGIAAIVKGLDGRSTVKSSLGQEHVVGLPYMTPQGISASARKAGLRSFDVPDCSVAGKPITSGATARCFGKYMRIDALIATGGKTYSQMPSFVSRNGKLTDDITRARFLPGGGPIPNPARAAWVTETALSTALNASYMAEQISLFGIGVGGALLLVGLLIMGMAIGGARIGWGAGQAAEPRRARMFSRT